MNQLFIDIINADTPTTNINCHIFKQNMISEVNKPSDFFIKTKYAFLYGNIHKHTIISDSFKESFLEHFSKWQRTQFAIYYLKRLIRKLYAKK